MKRARRFVSLVLAAALFLTQSTVIWGEEMDSGDKTLAPYFVVETEDPSLEGFPLKETQVNVNINGAIADIYVTQIYANEGKKPINASYVFPASTKVTVHGLEMAIGDQSVSAEIKEREKAKTDYEEAKNDGKSASMLEQQRSNVFTMYVANIMPNDVVRIELHYTELVGLMEGQYQFVYPTVVGPRYATIAQEDAEDTDQFIESPYLEEGTTPPGKYGITVNLATGAPITDLSCKSHETSVQWTDDSEARITLANPNDFAGNRDFILDYKLTGRDISSGLMLHKDEAENFFMLTVQPPERVELSDIPPREYIFVLDVSGSMNGYPLDTAKALIKNLVTGLREIDSFNVILFSGASSQMAARSVPATKSNIKEAVKLIDRQEGGGGTELAPALNSAVSMPMEENAARSIVIITDGYIGGEQEIFETIHNNLSKTNYFSFGIGTSVNRYLVDGIAKAGMGESFVVTDAQDANAAAERFCTYIQSPVLTDIKVAYVGFDAYDIEPLALPTLFAQRPLVLFGKWRDEPSGIIRITGKRGDKDFLQEIQVSESEPSETNSAIRYLWARTKVEQLLDYGYNKDKDDTKDEVTAIGMNYCMITPYTSFVAVIDTVRNEEKESTNVNQVLPLPLQVSNFAIGERYAVGSEPDILIVLVLVLPALLVNKVTRNRKKKM